MADLKLVYAAPSEEIALNELELFKDKWDSKYPKIYKSWHDNWVTLSTYFKYPEAVIRLIYTTNATEGFNCLLRKVTKSKTVFPSDDSLLKMLYLATMDITKKWTGHRQDCPYTEHDLMRFLFKLDDSIEVNIRPVIVNDEDPEYTTTGIYFGSEAILRIRGMLEQWQKMKEKYKNNEITKEALEDWKANFPDSLKKDYVPFEESNLKRFNNW